MTEMIFLYSGTPGSGKSLHQASDVYYWLKFGRPCIANYEINTEIIKSKHLGDFVYLPNNKLTPKFLIKYSKQYFKNHRFREGAIRVYIDEAQLMFNAREWGKNGREEWISFFTQHRKYGYDVYLVAQFDRMLDRQLRCLIEYEYVHRKCSNFGIKGKIFSLVAGGNLFVCVKLWYPLRNEKIGSNFFKYNKKFSKLYDTYKEFGEDDEENALQNTASETEKSFDFADERYRLLQNYAICINAIIEKKRKDNERNEEILHN